MQSKASSAFKYEPASGRPTFSGEKGDQWRRLGGIKKAHAPPPRQKRLVHSLNNTRRHCSTTPLARPRERRSSLLRKRIFGTDRNRLHSHLFALTSFDYLTGFPE